MDRIATQIDTSRLSSEQKGQLHQELEQKRREVAQQEAAEADRRAQAAREREAQAAAEQRVLEQQRKQDAEVAAKAELERQQREAEERAAAEQVQAETTAKAERFYEQHRAQLSPELVGFLDKNPDFKAPETRESLTDGIAVIEGEIFSLEICRAHNERYPTEWTESQRRLGLMQQLLMSYHGETSDHLAKAAESQRAKLNGELKQVLEGDDELRAQTCSAVLTESAQLADFSR